MPNVHQTKSLLIAEARRILELLHQQDITRAYDEQGYYVPNRQHSELKRKLREFRRDSIRFEKECRESHDEAQRRRYEERRTQQ